MPWVRPYVRSDGTLARGYSLRVPGAGQGPMIFGVGATAGEGGILRPKSTVQYPIRWVR